MSLTNVAANRVLDVLTRVQPTLSRPAGLYAALFSTAPTKTTPGVEFTTAVAFAYTRCSMGFTAAVNGVATAGFVSFPTGGEGPVDLSGAPTPWPPAVAIGVFDAASNGTLWYYELLPTRPVLTNGFYLSTAITLTLDS